ncbi:MAG: glucokinase [Pseudomonadota bacterium]
MDQSVLVGDVGGTSVRFALAHSDEHAISIDHFEKLPGDDFTCFEDAIDRYLSHQNITPKAALFALAGPVAEGEVCLTNRPWCITTDTLESKFGFENATLVNDFAAMARSVPELSDSCMTDIIAGDLRLDEPVLVAGAGTGLGMAALIPMGDRHWHVLSGEGGHAAFKPQTSRDFALHHLLEEEYGYVSAELICSGIGLEPVHRGLCTLSDVPFEPMTPAQILEAASQGDQISIEICSLRARTILAAAGDAALMVDATGGVVLAGGISSRLEDYLKAADSLGSFFERGPRRDYMSRIPIKLINYETAPLIGAAALYFEKEE